MSTPSIKVGQGNWGIKATSLLGYANTDKKFVAREFTVGRLLDTATRVNASGNIQIVNANVPRIDYFGGQASLLVEPSGSNLAFYSEQFDNAYWSKLRVNTSSWANQEIAPNNTLTAEKLTQASGETQAGVVFRSLTVSSGQVHTFSVFAKKGSRDFVALFSNLTGPTLGAYFDINNGTVGTISAGYSAKIENYGNGWFRCSITATSNSTSHIFFIYGVSANNTFTVPDDGGFQFIWGAQVETGSVATSYIPTTTGTVTRNNDNISLTGVSGLIGQTEGTIYAEAAYSNIDVVKTFAAITDGTTNNRIALRINSTASIAATIVVAGSANSITQSIPAIPSSGVLKIALGYKANDYALAINGTIYHFTTTRPVPATSAVTLGNNGFNADFFNDRIRAVSIYQTRLPNTTTDGSPSLQSITTL